MSRILHLLEDAFTLGVTLASDAIDSWSTGESRSAILQKLRDAVQRGSELALDKARLEDEVDGLRFNGPTLYKDEVDLLDEYATVLKTSLAFNGDKDYCEGVEERQRDLQIIQALLNRCDHLPMTSDELSKTIDDAISGKAKTFTWGDDIGKDVDGEAFFPGDEAYNER